MISPFHRGLIQRQPVTNDVASRPMVGEATEYNSASKYVAPFDGRKSTPRLPEKSGGRFAFNTKGLSIMKSILILARYASLLFASCLILNGCASKSEKINASYVSPLQYSDYSCKQIKGEIGRVGRKMNEVSGIQDDIASDDAVAMGVGLVLLWPALFFIEGSDQRVELARLKGEFDALEQVAIQKGCTVAKEIETVRQEAAARKAAEKTNSQKSRVNQ